MTKHKVQQTTGNYEEWLIHSLGNKKEAAAYLQVALGEYQNDGDLEAFLLALRHVAEAQGGALRGAKHGVSIQSKAEVRMAAPVLQVVVRLAPATGKV